jgi:uncharacterized protein YjbI with pentapeptide repeats
MGSTTKAKPTQGIQLPHIPKLSQTDAPASLENGMDYSMQFWVRADLSLQKANRITLEQIRFKRGNLNGLELSKSRLVDVAMETCDLSGAACTQIRLQRTEIADSRLIGINFLESEFDDVILKNSNFENLVFVLGHQKHTRYRNCNLRNARFEDTDLSGVIFDKCDLTGAHFRNVKLNGADFRGSIISEMALDPKEVRGIIIESAQAAQFVTLLGISIKESGE